jgi:hypothetical protein
MQTRLYELTNARDRITFHATPEDAAVIADIVAISRLGVTEVATSAPPEAFDTLAGAGPARAAIWASLERTAAYAAAFDSFLIGSPRQRAAFERAAPADEARAAFELRRADWHARHNPSSNDICARFWRIAAAIRDERLSAWPAPSIQDNAAPAAGVF